MPLTFNTILREANIPLGDVRLVRHQDQRSEKGRTPYELWRDNRPHFELYQSHQSIENRKYLKAGRWASFVGTPTGETLFIGLYRVKYRGPLAKDTRWPHADGVDKAGSCDVYKLTLEVGLADLEGKLFIEWGTGKRRWIQRADRRDKPIVELRATFQEPNFPGFLEFAQPLSQINGLPKSWIEVLKSCKGIYLLTCPKTREQYVGSATAEDGFWRRWQDYIHTGHGGNVGLKSRDPSDYQVSILEVAGTALTTDDIIRSEQRWKGKLQSREMGLNR